MPNSTIECPVHGRVYGPAPCHLCDDAAASRLAMAETLLISWRVVMRNRPGDRDATVENLITATDTFLKE